jgi:hypothetical protein
MVIHTLSLRSGPATKKKPCGMRDIMDLVWDGNHGRGNIYIAGITRSTSKMSVVGHTNSVYDQGPHFYAVLPSAMVRRSLSPWSDTVMTLQKANTLSMRARAGETGHTLRGKAFRLRYQAQRSNRQSGERMFWTTLRSTRALTCGAEDSCRQ